MELRDVDRFVREGKFAQALQAIDEVRASDPDNPYTAAYEVRVRALLEDARDKANTPILGAATMDAGGAPLSTPDTGATHRDEVTGAAQEMKRIAVLSRIADLLGSATGFLSKGEYDQALAALDQARVLDPENKEIAVFEDRVRVARQDALDLLRPPETAPVAEPEVSEVVEMLEAARTAAARGDFSEAFRSVTTAAILEPGNPDVIRCEAEIHAEQDRRRLEAAAPGRAEEAGDPGQQESHTEIADAHEERRHASAVIARHVERAQYLLEAREYGHALVEIDHAFLLNPLDPQVQRLQQEISAAQSRATRQAKDTEGTKASVIAGFFAEAHRLRARGKPEEALQAIGRILILDPMNREAHSFEQRLQSEIAIAAPLRNDLPPVPAPLPGLLTIPQDDQPRRRRRKTYLFAASFLAAAVVALFAMTQVLSWADAHKAQPGPPLPMILPDTTLLVDQAVSGTATGQAHAGRLYAADGSVDSTRGAMTSPLSIPGILRLEPPVLPETALGADGTQRVTVRVLVDQTGKPVLSAVVVSSNPAYNQPVINAVMSSSYARWSGKEASRWITIPFTFTN